MCPRYPRVPLFFFLLRPGGFLGFDFIGMFCFQHHFLAPSWIEMVERGGRDGMDGTGGLKWLNGPHGPGARLKDS
jgi:hypothetical protein